MIFCEKLLKTEYYFLAFFFPLDDFAQPKNKSFLLRLLEKIDYQNILILDNGNWNGDCYFYLRTKYKSYQDFIGINPRGDRTVTTVFHDRK